MKWKHFGNPKCGDHWELGWMTSWKIKCLMVKKLWAAYRHSFSCLAMTVSQIKHNLASQGRSFPPAVKWAWNTELFHTTHQRSLRLLGEVGNINYVKFWPKRKIPAWSYGPKKLVTSVASKATAWWCRCRSGNKNEIGNGFRLYFCTFWIVNTVPETVSGM